MKRRGQNRERCGALGNAGDTDSAGLPWSHCPVSGVVVEQACAASICRLRVRLHGFGKASDALQDGHRRLDPSLSSGHAWLETGLKCPFMAKGKNAQAEPELKTLRQRRRETGRCHHPAAPPTLPGDTSSGLSPGAISFFPAAVCQGFGN